MAAVLCAPVLLLPNRVPSNLYANGGWVRDVLRGVGGELFHALPRRFTAASAACDATSKTARAAAVDMARAH